MVYLKEIRSGVERANVFTVTRVTRIGNRIIHGKSKSVPLQARGAQRVPRLCDNRPGWW